MSEAYKNKEPLDIAKEAERDLNSYEAKTASTSKGTSDSSTSSLSNPQILSSYPLECKNPAP